MNRRQLLRSSAVLVGGSYLSPSFGHIALGQDQREITGPPKRLLSSTFTTELLRAKLVPIGAWHPYPRATERETWMQVPEDLRSAMIRRADVWKGKDWPSLLATTTLDFKRNGNRTRYESAQFGRRHRLIDLVLGECAAGDGRYLDEITNALWLICEESFWGAPAHLGAQKAKAGLPDVAEPIVDLFAAETASTLAWTDYLLGEKFNTVSPLISPRIRLEAKRRILDPLLVRNDFTWMGLQEERENEKAWIDVGANVVLPRRIHLNNWNPWINSNWLVTNMLLEPDSERRQRAIEKSCRSLDEFLSDYSPDGGCEEGPVYWQRSPGSYFDCARTLSSAVNGAADVMTHPFIQRMGQYIADVHIADNAFVNYGDAHMEDAPSPELVYQYGVAAKLPALSQFGAYHSVIDGMGAAGNGKKLEAALGAGLPTLARSLLYLMCARDIRIAKKADALGRDAWYPALHLMTAREKAGTVDGFYLAVQAASNGRSHGHNDSGSFIIFHAGEPVIIDPGVEAYTAETFSPERYTIWTMQSAFHNLPTIGDVMQHEGAPYAASEVKYATGDRAARITMNLATAYPQEAGAKQWIREVTLDRKAGQVRVTEEFTLVKSQTVTLSFMTSRVPSNENGAVVFHSGKTGVKDVQMKYDAAALHFTSEKIEMTDEGMRRSWGPALYRVQLKTVSAVSHARWSFEFA
ncbi:MAG TPA: heparinase II/III family protein [Edaphobacter sp.]|jgi:hypothetical protein|nr:heparinase II/III family protein [Edaphobacter sp.]